MGFPRQDWLLVLTSTDTLMMHSIFAMSFLHLRRKRRRLCTRLCKVMGMPGKPDSIDGSEVGRYFREGKIKEIADYCETDIVNTYRVWLRYELFRGKLTPIQFQFSEQKLGEFIKAAGEYEAAFGWHGRS